MHFKSKYLLVQFNIFCIYLFTSTETQFDCKSSKKVFQMEILQDSLAERIDKLIKKSSVVDSRLDIIEEELEEQTKISINGTVFFWCMYLSP